jgi:hypothetical protein
MGEGKKHDISRKSESASDEGRVTSDSMRCVLVSWHFSPCTRHFRATELRLQRFSMAGTPENP